MSHLYDTLDNHSERIKELENKVAELQKVVDELSEIVYVKKDSSPFQPPQQPPIPNPWEHPGRYTPGTYPGINAACPKCGLNFRDGVYYACVRSDCPNNVVYC